MGLSFLPSLLQGHRKIVSEGAKESRVWRSCGSRFISTSQYLHQTHTETEGGPLVESWLNAAWMLARCQGQVEGWAPLEQGAGAFWGWRRCVCRAVTHGQYVIVAWDVAAAGKVIGALGETGRHSIRSLQDAHGRLCDSLVKRGGKQ